MADSAAEERHDPPSTGKRRREKRPKKQEELFVSGIQAMMEQPLPEGTPGTSAPAAEPYELPCTLTGVGAGLSGGMLGYVFGFGPHLFTHKGAGRLKACNRKGWESAKTFAIMGGLYAAVSCLMKRIRLKEDAFNGGAAGCATGLALGWSGGPLSAAQSCVGLGLFSFVIDHFSNPGEAQAACLPQASSSGGTHNVCARPASSQQRHSAERRQQQWRLACSGQQQESQLSNLLRPALSGWLRPSCQAGCGSPLPGAVFLAQLLQRMLHEGRL